MGHPSVMGDLGQGMLDKVARGCMILSMMKQAVSAGVGQGRYRMIPDGRRHPGSLSNFNML